MYFTLSTLSPLLYHHLSPLPLTTSPLLSPLTTTPLLSFNLSTGNPPLLHRKMLIIYLLFFLLFFFLFNFIVPSMLCTLLCILLCTVLCTVYNVHCCVCSFVHCTMYTAVYNSSTPQHTSSTVIIELLIIYQVYVLL